MYTQLPAGPCIQNQLLTSHAGEIRWRIQRIECKLRFLELFPPLGSDAGRKDGLTSSQPFARWP